jgi:hypothetical protein
MIKIEKSDRESVDLKVMAAVSELPCVLTRTRSRREKLLQVK